MAQKQSWMIKIIRTLQKSKAYRVLRNLYEKGLFVKALFKKIKIHFVILERRINRILRNMKNRGLSDGYRVYFYRLVRKSLPAFSKFYDLNI